MDYLTAADVMTPEPLALRPDHTVERALREMTFAQIGHLPVVDANGHLVGLVAVRDVREPKGRVADVLRTDVITVSPTTSAHEVAYLLLRHRTGCVVVTDEETRVVGVVTESDFVRLARVLLGGRVEPDQLELEEEEAANV